MTPKERASKLAKDMVYTYEVCATMKDLDGVVHAWTMQAERAITDAEEAKVKEEREDCALIGDQRMEELKSVYSDSDPQEHKEKLIRLTEANFITELIRERSSDPREYAEKRKPR